MSKFDRKSRRYTSPVTVTVEREPGVSDDPLARHAIDKGTGQYDKNCRRLTVLAGLFAAFAIFVLFCGFDEGRFVLRWSAGLNLQGGASVASLALAGLCVWGIVKNKMKINILLKR